MLPASKDIYLDRYSYYLDPEAYSLYARLSDAAIELVRAAVCADTELIAPGNRPGTPGWLPRLCDRMRRKEPALDALSDQEFELALDIAIDTNGDNRA